MRNNRLLLQEEEISSHIVEKIMIDITEMMDLINHIDNPFHIMEIITHREMIIIMIIMVIRVIRIRDMKIIIITMMKMIVIIIDLIIQRIIISVKDLVLKEKDFQMLYHRIFLLKDSAHQSVKTNIKLNYELGIILNMFEGITLNNQK